MRLAKNLSFVLTMKEDSNSGAMYNWFSFVSSILIENRGKIDILMFHCLVPLTNNSHSTISSYLNSVMTQ